MCKKIVIENCSSLYVDYKYSIAVLNFDCFFVIVPGLRRNSSGLTRLVCCLRKFKHFKERHSLHKPTASGIRP